MTSKRLARAIFTTLLTLALGFGLAACGSPPLMVQTNEHEHEQGVYCGNTNGAHDGAEGEHCEACHEYHLGEHQGDVE